MQKHTKKSYVFPALLGIIGLLSLLLITKHGIGISPDSVTYIAGANNLLIGKGFSSYTLSPDGVNTPITSFPPLFSMVIAFIIFLNNDPVAGARLLNSLLFGANIFLIGLIINKATYNSIWFSILGSFLMLTSIDMLSISSFAYTEPMFIFFTVLGLYLLCLYIDNSNKLLLTMSAFSISLSFLTRYSGVPCIITGIIGIFLLSRENYYKRVLDSLFFMIISILPMSIWVARNFYLSGATIGRTFIYHQAGLDFIKSLLPVISKWLLPSDYLSVYMRIILLSALIILLVIFIYPIYRKVIFKTRTVDNHLIISFPVVPSLYSCYFLLYLLFIFFSKLFFDAYIPFDSRILSPLFGPFIIILLYLIYKIYYYGYRPNIKIALCVLCFLFATVYLVQGLKWALNAQKDGHGYSSIVWKKSDILNNINKIVLKRIYSNACDAVYIIADKSCYSIPNKYDPSSLQMNKNYISEISSFRKEIQNNNAVLVWSNKFSRRRYLPSEEELIKELNLKLIIKYNDGTIYGPAD